MQRCMICEEEQAKGIQLHTAFICQACEYNMVHTDAREVKYQYYIEKLKHIRERSVYHSI